MILAFVRHGAATLAVALVAALAPAQSAQSVEVVPRPGAQLVLAGHGYGHGRGMSQWGAYGAATAGLSYQQILAFYYPGTSRQSLANDTIRVALTDNDGDTTVAPAVGLQVRTSGGRAVLPTGAAYTRWRALGTSVVRLEHRDAAGIWRPWSAPGLTMGNELWFSADAGLVRVQLPTGVWQDVRGVLHATTVSGTLRSVLHTPMETYLRGVVPNEMPASWHRQALAAQAVAARTYAAAYRQRQRAAGSWYDICDTTSCQVFSGVAQYPDGARQSREDTRTDAAISDTTGVVLRTDASARAPFVHAEFSSANGGYTAAGSLPYQVSKADPYDGRIANGSHSWTDTVAVGQLDRLGVGTFRRLVILTRDGRGDYGGRVLTARLEGDGGSREVTGDDLRWLFGLRSNWFSVTSSVVAPGVQDWNSDGIADILAREPNGDLTLFAGSGGAFTAGQKIGNGWGAMLDLVAMGDFDGQAGQDVIARRSDHRLLLYTGDGHGGWTGQREIGNGWGSYRSLVSPGDWTGDGRPDLIAVNRVTQELVMSKGLGGRLGNPVRIGVGWGAMVRLIAPRDFDGDGRNDLLAQREDGNLYLYSGDGAGRFLRQRQVGNGWGGMAHIWSPGDVDGDLKSDILAIDQATGTLRLYRGAGNGEFGAVSSLGSGWADRTPVG